MFFPTLFAFVLFLPQSEKPAAPQDGLALLNEVGQHYAQAKSYHIEAVEERTSTGELSRSWQKTLLKASAIPGGRYRYEGRSSMGTAAYVSDGTTQWIYHANEHAYTQKSASGETAKHNVITAEEMAAETAQRLVRIQAHRADSLKSATLLPEETISIGGKDVSCYVVRYSQDDFKTKRANQKEDWTIWILKDDKTVVQTLSHGHTRLLPSNTTLAIETKVVYEVVKLGQQEPAEVFTFTPPSDSRLVDEFPEMLGHDPDMIAANFLQKSAPELNLKSSDGKATALSSFRSKPVFIDYWATSCAPCVDLIPELKKLYTDTNDKGLVWISVDSDQNSTVATDFLSREHVPWPNYHDADGSMGLAYQREGIPLGVLVDAERKVVFYKSGYEIPELRGAISKLGPQFSAVETAKPTQ